MPLDPKGIRNLWQGADVFIIGGGSSLRGFDFSLIYNKRIIGCNDAYQLGPWVDICYFGDGKWLTERKENRQGFNEFKGFKVHLEYAHKIKRKEVYVYKRGRNAFGINKNPGLLAWNLNTGLSAINLAYHLGAKRVILIGFDMKRGVDGKGNWHDNHLKYKDDSGQPKKGKKRSIYDRWLENINKIKGDAEKFGLEILNAGPDSAIDIFPMVKLEDVV